MHNLVAKKVFKNEIFALKQASKKISANFDSAVNLLLSLEGKIVFTGLGKSGIIAHKIAATFASTGTPAIFVNAAEGLHGDLGVVSRKDIVFMVSNSGETEELYRWLPVIKKYHIRLIGILGNSVSKLASHCDCILDSSVEVEACPLGLAPMSSTTVALVIGDALAAALMSARGFTREEFAEFHPSGALGRRLLFKVSDVMLRGIDLPIVSPESSLREAVVELDRCNIGMVVALSPDKKVVGILSEGDLRRLILRETSMTTPFNNVMTSEPLVVEDKQLLVEALSRMEKFGRKVYVLPVINSSGEMVGALRMHDIVSH